MDYAVLGWLIALEKTVYVLYLQIFMNILNLILDVIFVLYLGWGIEGVAFVSLIAELTAAFMSLMIRIKLYLKSGLPKISNLF